jgi:hypothetical protein
VCCLQELEAARRLYLSQKRALKDALSAAAERDAADVAAGESRLEAATAAAEEEVERLALELSQLKTRSLLELQAKEAELAQLQQQLVQHEEDKCVSVVAGAGGGSAAADGTGACGGSRVDVSANIALSGSTAAAANIQGQQLHAQAAQLRTTMAAHSSTRSLLTGDTWCALCPAGWRL